MIEPSLDGAFERINRAEEHIVSLKEFAADFESFDDSIAISEIDETDAREMFFEGTQQIPIAHVKHLAPHRVSILVGEICYNLRAALDYLVFELAILDSGKPQQGTQFVIADEEKLFWEKQPTQLRGLNRCHIAAIERQLQPYKGEHFTWPATLREISNVDKHRMLPIVAGHGLMWSELAPKDDAGTPGKVRVKFPFATYVTFHDGTPVVPALEILKLNVAETVNAFKPEF